MNQTYLRTQQQLDERVSAWFARPAGRRLIELEQPLLKQMTEDLFGYYLVQIQGFGHSLDLFAESPIKHRLQMDLSAGKNAATAICARSEVLPLATASIDAVVLPHTLDFALDPHQVLREVERVLIAQGRVILLGFNPVSLWGLRRSISRHQAKVPWSGHFIPYQRTSDWLNVLGFDIESSGVCAFSPPMSDERWASRLHWLDVWGQRLTPGLSGVYALRAVKRVSTVKPIKMRTQRLPVFAAGAAALGK